jgi:hypothetical protein
MRIDLIYKMLFGEVSPSRSSLGYRVKPLLCEQPVIMNTLWSPRMNFADFQPLRHDHPLIMNVNAFFWSRLYTYIHLVNVNVDRGRHLNKFYDWSCGGI